MVVPFHGPRTATSTSGFVLALVAAVVPAATIGRVEIPRRSARAGIPRSSATLLTTSSLRTISETVAGFVARLWIWAFAFGESGWPR